MCKFPQNTLLLLLLLPSTIFKRGQNLQWIQVSESYLINVVAVASGPAVFAGGAAPKLFPGLPLEEVPDGGIVLGSATERWLWCARGGVGPSVHAW